MSPFWNRQQPTVSVSPEQAVTQIPHEAGVKHFYLLVEDVLVLVGRGTVVTGRVQGETINSGDVAHVFRSDGSAIETKVLQIGAPALESFSGPRIDSAKVGETVGLLLRGIAAFDVNKGDVISSTDTLPDGVQPQPEMGAADDSIQVGDQPGSILDQYRAALAYLDSCETFDETALREFNRLSGSRFSEADMENQLGSAKLMLRGMDDLKQSLRSSTAEAIGVFEQLAQSGIDLSKYNL
ncbi:MAG: hypothetical protein FWD63_01860 [Propionibacteriaceae bacterium]|nr:hypothetical protein [Propionibacteriaceae bacterium]